MGLGRKHLRIAVAAATTAVLAVGSTLVATTTAQAAPVKITGYEQCLTAQWHQVGSGWAIYEPSVWESNKTNCNLKYGDLPRRYPAGYVGDPATAIKALQRNLNYCYGSKLVVDGKYGSKTKAAVLKVQRTHKIAADGVYGPKTRAAMKWRMYNSAKKVWSTACYDKF